MSLLVFWYISKLKVAITYDRVKISKRSSEAINRRRTDVKMAKRKGTKRQAIGNKILLRKIKIEQREHH